MAKVKRNDRMRKFAEFYSAITLATNLIEDEANKFGMNFDRPLISKAASTGALHYISQAEEDEINKTSVYKAAKEAGDLALDGLNTSRGE